MHKKLVALFTLWAFLARALYAQDAGHFPVPESIKPAIHFWTRVYTEVDTQSGFLHDSRDLNIVYARLPRDTKQVEERRKAIVADLQVLASGKRQGLTESQQHILSLWGASTDNERFRLAAQNVRWQLGQSDRFREGMVRSGAYRPHIDAILKERGLPPELAMLPHVESSFHPGATSSVAATGMWQFMRETAQRFMRVDLVVDERLDPWVATEGAMDLLEYNYSRLGTWPLALTAYNHGTNGMARAVKDTGTDDIGRIISEYGGPRFGFASRNFYPQFLAALHVDTNAEQYFGPITKEEAPDFVSVTLSAYVDAVALATSLGVDIATLRRYNPALMPSVWNGSKRIPAGYTLKLDRRSYGGNLQASVAAMAPGNFYTAQIPDVSYVVQRGDTLSGIAARFSTTVAELATINQLRDRHSIRIGQTLILPAQDGSVPSLVVSNQPAPGQSQPAAQVAAAATVPANGEYEIRRGDTLSAIARRFNMPLATLLALNGLDEGAVIQPGQRLVLRASGRASTLLASEEAAPARDLQQAMQAAAQAAAAPTVINLAVASDGRVEVQAEETLGHFADWLQVTTTSLRQLNGLGSAGVRAGQKLKLDFSRVDKQEFEARRRRYHEELQAQYFASWRIRETEQYSIRRSDLLVNLARERSLPLWLIRQYNPDVDVSQLKIGQVLVFPVVERISSL